MIRLAYFFVPLPESLPLPNRYTLTVWRHVHPKTLEKLESAYSADEVAAMHQYLAISASIKLWHTQWPLTEPSLIDVLFGIAHKALPGLFSGPGGRETAAELRMVPLSR